MKQHKVKQGECLVTIAQRYGFSDWKTIYEAPENESFRELRPNPHCLFPGDELFIPEKGQYRKATDTNVKQKYVIRKQKSFLSVRLINRKLEALSDIPYNIAFYQEEAKEPVLTAEDQRTDADGFIQMKIPLKARKAVVRYFPYKEQPSLLRHMTLELSELDPVNEESGKRERLRQLGYPVEKTTESETDRYQQQIDSLSKRFSLSGDEAVEDFLENPEL